MKEKLTQSLGLGAVTGGSHVYGMPRGAFFHDENVVPVS